MPAVKHQIYWMFGLAWKHEDSPVARCHVRGAPSACPPLSRPPVRRAFLNFRAPVSRPRVHRVFLNSSTPDFLRL